MEDLDSPVAVSRLEEIVAEGVAEIVVEVEAEVEAGL